MARKATVDRNLVLQLLKEGKTSQSIAMQFGVSRQAIDLYRKEFFRTGLLQNNVTPLPVTTPNSSPPINRYAGAGTNPTAGFTTRGCFSGPDDRTDDSKLLLR